MVVNRIDTSAYTIGLMYNGPASAASARASADHSSQTGSSVRMSNSTLLSTSVPPAISGAPGEGHDLVGRHLDIPASLEALRQLASARRPPIALAHDDGVLAALE